MLMRENTVPGLPVITGYGDGGFRVSGRRIVGSLIIMPDRVESWDAQDMDSISLESLAPLLQTVEDIEVVLIGCGVRMSPLSAPVRAALEAAPFGYDLMDTGAACRTHNILLSEDRRVAAALIAV